MNSTIYGLVAFAVASVAAEAGEAPASLAASNTATSVTVTNIVTVVVTNVVTVATQPKHEVKSGSTGYTPVTSAGLTNRSYAYNRGTGYTPHKIPERSPWFFGVSIPDGPPGTRPRARCYALLGNGEAWNQASYGTGYQPYLLDKFSILNSGVNPADFSKAGCGNQRW